MIISEEVQTQLLNIQVDQLTQTGLGLNPQPQRQTSSSAPHASEPEREANDNSGRQPTGWSQRGDWNQWTDDEREEWRQSNWRSGYWDKNSWTDDNDCY